MRGHMTLSPVALLGVLLAACAGSAAAPGDVPYGERFTLRIGDTAAVGGDGLRVTFEKVSLDSRCPVDVVCVQAGEAVAVLRFEADAAPATREVSTAPGRNTVTVGQYRTELLGMQPVPRSDRKIAPEDYGAELRVTLDAQG